MSRSRLVATLTCGLITLGILATPAGVANAALSSPQSATQVVQLGTANVVKATNSEKSKTAEVLADSSVTVTAYPSQYGSLSGISTAFYGNAGYWPGLCQANGIANCNAIQIGQQIKVPASAPQATAPVHTAAAAPVQQAAPANSSAAQTIVNYALAQVGKAYVWAAAGPWAFDCSGLVMQALAQVGVYVPHQDQGILYSGKGYAVSRSNLQPGDIVWPYNGHVFIYIGNNKIVEAAQPGVGVIVNNLYGFMAARRFV
jgi:cell wall-associated NlpC family hydrolase